MTSHKRIKVLFVCALNTSRSQMAEAFLSHFAGERFEAHSAGLWPETIINPLAVEVMREIGLDISKNRPKGITEFCTDNTDFDFFITVCDKVSSVHCTVLSGFAKIIHWYFEDPADLEDDRNSKLERTRHIRDKIQIAVQAFIAQISFIE